jgi:hypothetical protein
MEVHEFLTGLLERGAVYIQSKEPPGDSDFAACQDLLADLDKVTRLDMAFDPPEYVAEASQWAAARLYSACLFLVHRDADAEEVRRALSVPCPGQPGPATVYSTDLLLRYLPDVYALARGLSPDDPLVEALRDLGRAWPLSSVGMEDIGAVDISTFIENRALRQLYVDRILEREDVSRTDHPLVRECVMRSVGLARDLCPRFGHLFEERTTT